VIIVISRPDYFRGEQEQIIALFEAGMSRFHLRKPGITEAEIEQLIMEIPEKYYKKMVIHYHLGLALKYQLAGVHLSSAQPVYESNLKGISVSRSCHTISELEQYDGQVDYMFLSPVKDSISKPGYQSELNDQQIRKTMLRSRKSEVFGLGGIDVENIKQVSGLGFDGVAVLGAVWQHIDATRSFRELQNAYYA